MKFELSDPKMGSVDGNAYTTCDEDAGVTGGTITAKCVWDESKTSTATITFGKASKILFDFEDGTAPVWKAESAYGNTKYGRFETADYAVVDSSTGKVRNGKYSLAFTADFSTTTASGWKGVTLYLNQAINMTGATAFGMWMYLPVDANNLEFDFGNLFEFYPANYSTIKDEGWYYVSAPVVAGKTLSKFTIYMNDPDETYANIFDKFTIYLDDLTLDYSDATEDREIPQFTGVNVSTGLDTFAPMNGQTINTNTFIVKATAQDDLTGNYTGLNYTTAKVYVDGAPLSADQYTCDGSGVITVSDITLPNGTHTFRFEISDNNGNVGFTTKQIVVNTDKGDVAVVRRSPSTVQPLAGSIEYFDVVAAKAENIKSVNLQLDLDTLSAWELQGADVLYGFDMTYYVDDTTNTAYITLTKNSMATASGETVIASLPVRVWQTSSYLNPKYIDAGLVNKKDEDGNYVNESNSVWTPDIMWNTDRARIVRIELNAEVIDVQYTDGTDARFSQKQINVITEYNRYRSSGYYQADGTYVKGDTTFVMQGKNCTHLHTPTALTDAPATCTTAGYTGRTYCEGCKSVIDWGTKVDATGHNYELADGVLKCCNTGCNELCNGLYTDGKTYVDGVVIADGWDGESYYRDGVKLTGLQKIDGYYYDFGTDGICDGKARLDGFYYDTAIKSYRYFAGGIMTVGDVSVNLIAHFFDENGVAISGEKKIMGYTCRFDEKGKFVSSEDSAVLEAGYIGTNLQYVLLHDGSISLQSTQKHTLMMNVWRMYMRKCIR